jgi:hypothetical protein
VSPFTRAWVLASALTLSVGVAGAVDPTTADCLAASEASFKSAGQHKLREERSALLVCAAASCPADIRKECMSRVNEVSIQIPSIIFAAKDASGADLSAVKVSMDGEILAERLEGLAISVDPGEHTFVYETAGHARVSKTIIVQEAERERREVVVFGATTSTGTPESAPRTTEVQPKDRAGLGVQKVWALVAGGLGIAGLGIGTAFGVAALSKKSDAEGLCPNQCATRAGVDEWSSATTFGNISTMGLAVGGVVLAGGVILWFTAKPNSSQGPSAQVGLGPGSAQLRGVW